MTSNQKVIEDQETFPLVSGELNIQDRFYLQWGRVAQWPHRSFWASGSRRAMGQDIVLCFSRANILNNVFISVWASESESCLCTRDFQPLSFHSRLLLCPLLTCPRFPTSEQLCCAFGCHPASLELVQFQLSVGNLWNVQGNRGWLNDRRGGNAHRSAGASAAWLWLHGCGALGPGGCWVEEAESPSRCHPCCLCSFIPHLLQWWLTTSRLGWQPEREGLARTGSQDQFPVAPWHLPGPSPLSPSRWPWGSSSSLWGPSNWPLGSAEMPTMRWWVQQWQHGGRCIRAFSPQPCGRSSVCSAIHGGWLLWSPELWEGEGRSLSLSLFDGHREKQIIRSAEDILAALAWAPSEPIHGETSCG